MLLLPRDEQKTRLKELAWTRLQSWIQVDARHSATERKRGKPRKELGR